ncbi:MAG: UDP-glucose 4-epimerase [Pseudomonadota bacterium]|jgi:nucleoside-diphosphate-sugar epimerase
MKVAVIFGGTGFIGLHFTRFLLDQASFDKIVLADIKPPEQHIAHRFVKSELQSGRVVYVKSDVREPISTSVTGDGETVSFIANFAAVHREPGHEHWEYFHTNIPGARHVCAYAETVGCDDILFTSSISPYGPTENPKDESVIPTPETAYGSSKYAAELIHTAWRDRSVHSRRLLVVRPGVVFGPGEGGNVSRLVKMLTKGFFVFAGNQDTRKAGIYVKELCHAMWWMHERQATRAPGIATANMTMNPGPSMQEYVETVQKVLGKKAIVPSIPAWALMFAARVVEIFTTILQINTSVNTVRVRKLIRSNNIVPGVLAQENYPYVYTLETALQDWLKSLPEEWGR